MKRMKVIFVAVLLITCLLFNTLEVSAYSYPNYEPTINYSTVAHHHFAKLESNIPENVIGSCAYVSMSLMLSFYDSYWNDIFVPENFEHNVEWDEEQNKFIDARPGFYVYSNNFNSVPLLNLENDEWTSFEADGGTYTDFVNNQSNRSMYLHLFLISLGIARGYHSGDSDFNYGLGITGQVTVLDDYFDLIFGEANYAGTNGTYDDNLPVEIHFISTHAGDVNREDVISKINEQLAVGNPVTYNGWNIEGNENNNLTSDKDDLENTKVGHSMVAYAVETKSDGTSDILLHKGHIGNPYTSVNQTEYSHNIEACWIEINEDVLPHVCPTENEEESFYDYVDIIKKKGVCACQIYGDKHPSHNHEIYDVIRRETDNHIYYCICGVPLTEPHCNFSYEQSSSTAHNAICECGYKITDQPHQFTEFTNQSNLYHKAYCACGYSRNEMHVTQSINNRYSKCTICGAVFDMWSTPTIKGVNDPPPESEQ